MASVRCCVCGLTTTVALDWPRMGVCSDRCLAKHAPECVWEGHQSVFTVGDVLRGSDDYRRRIEGAIAGYYTRVRSRGTR